MPKPISNILDTNATLHAVRQDGFGMSYAENTAVVLSQTAPSTDDIKRMMDELHIPQTSDTDTQITRIQQHRDQFDAFMNTFYGSIDPMDLKHIQTAQAGMSFSDLGSMGGLIAGGALAFIIYYILSRYRNKENQIQRASVNVGITLTRFFVITFAVLIILAIFGSYLGLKNLTSGFFDEEHTTIDIEQEKQETSKQEFASKAQELVSRLHIRSEFDIAIYRGPECMFEFEFPKKPGLILRIETIGGLNQGNVLIYTCTLLQDGQELAVQVLERDMTDRRPRLTSQLKLGSFRQGQSNGGNELPKLGKVSLTRAKVSGSNGGNIQVAGPEPEEDEYNPTMNPTIFSSSSKEALYALFERLGGPIPKGTYVMKDESNNVRVQIQMQNEQKGTIIRIIGANLKMAQIQQIEISYNGNKIHWQYGKIWTNTIQAGQEELLEKRMAAVQTNLQNGNWTLVK
ncbi:MAG: hypothetical protein WC004_05100 [Candidatus Absconditabacterales bacterium]